MVLAFKVVAGKKESGQERKRARKKGLFTVSFQVFVAFEWIFINKSMVMVNSISASNFAHSQQHLRPIRSYSKDDWSTQENSSL